MQTDLASDLRAALDAAEAAGVVRRVTVPHPSDTEDKDGRAWMIDGDPLIIRRPSRLDGQDSLLGGCYRYAARRGLYVATFSTPTGHDFHVYTDGDACVRDSTRGWQRIRREGFHPNAAGSETHCSPAVAFLRALAAAVAPPGAAEAGRHPRHDTA